MPHPQEKIISTERDHCLWIQFNRPEVKNALDTDSFIQLRALLQQAQQNTWIRCVIITGNQQAFTSGMDMNAMDPKNIADYESSGETHPAIACITTICEFDKPLLAAVDGVAVGLGLTLLLHCDKVFITENARFKAPFIDLGVVPEAAASYLLPQLVGYKRAVEILFHAQWISAAQAISDGIADVLCASDKLLTLTEQESQLICQKAPNAIQQTKRLMLAHYRKHVLDTKLAEDAAFHQLVGGAENTEAITAFFEKRPAKFL